MKRFFSRFISVVWYNFHTRQRLFLTYLLAIMFPVILLTSVFFFYISDSIMNTRCYSAFTSSQQVASQMDSAFQQADEIANSLTLNSDFNEVLDSVNRDNNYFEKRGNIMKLFQLKPALKEYDHVYRTRFYFSEDVITANHTDLFYLSEIDQEYLYQKMVQNQGGTVWTTFSNQEEVPDCGPTISMVRPLYNPANMMEISGYIRVDYLCSDLQEQILSSLPSQHSQGCLVDESGTIIISTAFDESINRELLLSLEEINPLSNKDGSFYREITIDSQKMLLCVSQLTSNGMRLLYAIPFSELVVSGSAILIIAIILIFAESIITVVFGAVLSLSIARSNDLQLQLLYSQLNPHFLYNTLDMINWKAIQRDAPEIYQPIQALSHLYKLTLNKGSVYIRVEDELEHIRLYIQLQNMRFNNTIRLRTDYAPGTLHLFILNMLLQPIVENAVIHGILEKQDHSGTLTITSKLDHDCVRFFIEDDGVGIPSETLSHIWKERKDIKGYGMWNIQERIRIAYGKSKLYGISIQSHTGIGTRVTLTLPIQKKSNGFSSVH